MSNSSLQRICDIKYELTLSEFCAEKVRCEYWKGEDEKRIMKDGDFEDLVDLRTKYISFYNIFENLMESFLWCRINEGVWSVMEPQSSIQQKASINSIAQERECRDIMKDLAKRIVATFERFPPESTHNQLLCERYKKLIV